MPGAAIEGLQVVNQRLRARLARLPGKHRQNRPAVIVPTEFTDLRVDLLQANNCLRSLPTVAPPNAEVENEISEYRRNVRQLEIILPSVQARLLIEKARLQTARAHVARAAAWAQGSKKTL